MYLIDERDVPVAFWKDKIYNYTNLNPEHKWIHLRADKAVGLLKEDYEAGMI